MFDKGEFDSGGWRDGQLDDDVGDGGWNGIGRCRDGVARGLEMVRANMSEIELFNLRVTRSFQGIFAIDLGFRVDLQIAP